MIVASEIIVIRVNEKVHKTINEATKRWWDVAMLMKMLKKELMK
jgi:hypothetical protein